jgi:hypothetical protein
MSGTGRPEPQAGKLQVTAAMGELLANALMKGRPATIAYVDRDARPQISHRGTLQRLNDSALAMWARNPEGGVLKAIAHNPAVAVLCSDFSDRAHRSFLVFAGQAHIDSSEEIRSTVFDNSPEIERRADPERKGIAIVIDVDKIDGLLDGQFLRMRRD